MPVERSGSDALIGSYVYAGHELREKVRDRDGNERTGIVFHCYVHLFDRQRTDEAVRLAMARAR
jgi:hypothetical protein